jgi:hypothetical protein
MRLFNKSWLFFGIVVQGTATHVPWASARLVCKSFFGNNRRALGWNGVKFGFCFDNHVAYCRIFPHNR